MTPGKPWRSRVLRLSLPKPPPAAAQRPHLELGQNYVRTMDSVVKYTQQNHDHNIWNIIHAEVKCKISTQSLKQTTRLYLQTSILQRKLNNVAFLVQHHRT